MTVEIGTEVVFPFNSFRHKEDEILLGKLQAAMESQERIFIVNQVRAKEASGCKSECNKHRIR
jgi:hypothetical protein